ncbi:MAG: DUF4197 domain-containing protein [Pseudomonadota bacterium]|nr:DUF4197 domain-containing protein [Pseudomonadota bacterium]MDO7710502.1 DUF4197 domain-containing protein [Pseudomonadota bacterium]
MRRVAAIILISMALTSCSSFVYSAKQTTQVKFQHFLANQFGQQLEKGIDSVIEQLTMKGGYLDDPLVRILLPPPLGLVIGIARDLQTNPQATLLETLINQAAESTIPVAGPILKNIVMNMTIPSLENLMTAGNTAATDYLKEKSGVLMQTLLLPAITEELHTNGAIELYGQLLQAKKIADQIPTTLTDDNQLSETFEHQLETVKMVTPELLGNYVAEQAMSGLFKKVAAKELSIRKKARGL